MHRATDAPYVDMRVDDGDEIKFGKLSLKVVYTPGHTQDAMCLLFNDRIFTGDTLLIGGCGRTDLPGRQRRAAVGQLGETQSAWRSKFASFPVTTIARPSRRSATKSKKTRACKSPPKKNSFSIMTSRKPPLPRKIQEALEWNRTPIQGTQRGIGRRNLAYCLNSQISRSQS